MAAQIPAASGIIRTRPTPRAPMAPSMRCTMLAFSAVENTEARLTSRRMSLPDIGLAMMPTVVPVSRNGWSS